MFSKNKYTLWIMQVCSIENVNCYITFISILQYLVIYLDIHLMNYSIKLVQNKYIS